MSSKEYTAYQAEKINVYLFWLGLSIQICALRHIIEAVCNWNVALHK